MEFESFIEVIHAIRAGKLDDELIDLREAVARRREVLSRQRFMNLKVGDEVTFASDVGKGLGGTKATVIAKMRKNVRVKAIDGQVWNASPSILEL